MNFTKDDDWVYKTFAAFTECCGVSGGAEDQGTPFQLAVALSALLYGLLHESPSRTHEALAGRYYGVAPGVS